MPNCRGFAMQCAMAGVDNWFSDAKLPWVPGLWVKGAFWLARKCLCFKVRGFRRDVALYPNPWGENVEIKETTKLVVLRCKFTFFIGI